MKLYIVDNFTDRHFSGNPAAVCLSNREREPATPAVAFRPPDNLLDAFGVQPTFVGKSRFDMLFVVNTEDVVRSLTPDFAKLSQIGPYGAVVTGPSSDSRFDFVSRYFAPAFGLDEDPVTGSVHCCLGPCVHRRSKGKVNRILKSILSVNSIDAWRNDGMLQRTW